MDQIVVPEDAPYKNPTLALQDRVSDLLARMSLTEKIAQLHGYWLYLEEDGQHKVRPGPAFLGSSDQATLKERLSMGVGQITRPLGTRSVDAAQGLRALNALQRFLKNETRLGIPAIAHEECLVGLMTRDGTLFPSALALSATWNPELVEAVAKITGDECRAVGCHQGLAPVLDVSRDVRWGRTEETFGEDPYLVGTMGVAYVRGLQGPKRDLLATLKHFAAHSFSEGARNHAPVNVGWRTLNDVFLLPFEMAVRLADAGSVMPAYHDIDGEPSHASHLLLTKILRQQWGFDGLVVADYGGVSLLHQHHAVTTDGMESAVLALKAGLDMELPGDDCAKHIGDAVQRGLLSPEELDTVVARVLSQKFRLGLFEKDFQDPISIPKLRQPASVQLAREAARQAVVVLDNLGGVLPLDPSAGNRIALIGPAADDPLALMSAYSYPAHVVMHNESGATDHIVTPRQALEAMYGKDKIVFSPGCDIISERRAGAPVFPGDLAPGMALQKSPVSSCMDGIPGAVEIARSADIAIVCVGDLAGMFQSGTVGEGSDVDRLSLPGVQQALLEAIVQTGVPTIAVLMGGRPYDLGGLEDRLAAYVMAFAGGQQGGQALVDVLSGQEPPSGRMTVSVPRSAGAMPYFYNYKLKSAGTPVAFHFGSRYPFGHGQSLTQFEYSDLKLAAHEVPINGEIGVSFTIKNIGPRTGVGVPQLYVRDRHASVVRPVRELKAFARVVLKPGEMARIDWCVPVDMLSFTGADDLRCVEPGWFDLSIGSSSADPHLGCSVQVHGEARQLNSDWRMTSNTQIHRL